MSPPCCLFYNTTILVSLRELCAFVDEVAEEEEVVLQLNGKRVTHEGCGVDNQGTCYLVGDSVK